MSVINFTDWHHIKSKAIITSVIARLISCSCFILAFSSSALAMFEYSVDMLALCSFNRELLLGLNRLLFVFDLGFEGLPKSGDNTCCVLAVCLFDWSWCVIEGVYPLFPSLLAISASDSGFSTTRVIFVQYHVIRTNSIALIEKMPFKLNKAYLFEFFCYNSLPSILTSGVFILEQVTTKCLRFSSLEISVVISISSCLSPGVLCLQPENASLYPLNVDDR